MELLREFHNHKFIETFPVDTVLNFNIIQFTLRQVTLLIITFNYTWR